MPLGRNRVPGWLGHVTMPAFKNNNQTSQIFSRTDGRCVNLEQYATSTGIPTRERRPASAKEAEIATHEIRSTTV
jgi:hypothetical protein